MYFLMFPGQGASVTVGMGKALYDAFPVAREVFQEVDETLHQNLTRICFYGPAEDLVMTENAQPALMTVCLAVLRVLEKEADFQIAHRVEVLGGHSLGEYAALAAARVVKLSECAKLLRIRGQAMQEAVPPGVGRMAAVLGLDVPDVEEVCQEAAQDQVCELANDNAPGQIVVSGHKEAVERAEILCLERGAKRVVPLPVSAPFHCSLMKSAGNKMAQALETVSFENPLRPIIQNVVAQDIYEPQSLKDNLVRQVAGRVRWTESMETLKNRKITAALEIGPGKVLSGLMKRTCPDISCLSIHLPEDIEHFVKNSDLVEGE